MMRRPDWMTLLIKDEDRVGRARISCAAARIAEAAAAHRRGDPIPDVTYTAEEDEAWRTVSAPATGS